MQKSSQCLYPVIGILLIILGCVFSSSAAEAVRLGIRLCIEQLIPALFLFLVASELLKSGQKNKVTAHPSRIPNGFWTMLLLTAVGGYPIGAVCVRRALQSGSISLRQAKRLSCVLFCGGPGFFLNFIGVSLYHSTAFGLLLAASQLFSLLIGVLGYLVLSRRETTMAIPEAAAPIQLPQAIVTASRSMASICATVIFFFALRGITDPLFKCLPKTAVDLLSGFLEVTSGCSGLNAFKQPTKAILTAFFCGFGGFCVHLQVYGILSDAAPRYPVFLMIRILLGTVSAGFFALFMRFLPQDTVSCFTAPNGMTMTFSTDSTAVIFLLMITTVTLCASFVTYLRRD